MYGDKANGFMFAPIDSDEMRSIVMVFGDIFLRNQEVLRQAQEARTSSDRWQMLMDAAPVGIFQTDPDHRYTYTNPRWSEITGVRADAALGQDWQTIVDFELSSRLVNDEALGNPRRSEVSRRIELRVSGSRPKIALLTVKEVVNVDGRCAGWVGSLADLTAVAASPATATQTPPSRSGSAPPPSAGNPLDVEGLARKHHARPPASDNPAPLPPATHETRTRIAGIHSPT
jgi:PAS domain S-box-containing protein